MNSVHILGRLGNDPELKTFDSGNIVCNMSVATGEKWKDKTSGEMKESTEWHRINVYGKQAENCGKYLSKGSEVFIEGRLQTRSWEDPDSKKRYATEIIAKNVQFIGGKAATTEPDASGEQFNVNEDESIPF